ncbi:hypothetical protein ACEYXF_12255 [Streptomyces asiaticus]|uniref:hypothetical protein n=1 Tax=Streptomyces asiaticus TaxID=114695 RepID=UPI0039BDFE9F
MTPFPPPLLFTESWEYELRFPRDPRGPGVVRATLRAVLTAHGLRELVERAALLTSELTTILDILADRWGGCAIGEEPFGLGGKTLWFELSWGGPPQPPAPAPALAA